MLSRPENPNPAARGAFLAASIGAALVSLAAFSSGFAFQPTPPLPAITTPAPAEVPKRTIRYGRDIRPILADRCFQCHGPDRDTREADLRLDSREEGLRDLGGAAAIVPGNPGDSELWLRITDPHDSDAMPPPKSNKARLSAEQQGLIKAWIEQGAKYEPHWAFSAPVRPPVPAVSGDHWSRNEIDRFVLSALAEDGITPSPEEEPAALLRRVMLDLTGLPPTPQELDEFLAAGGALAYERWVDRLLTTEPYKTRMAEHFASGWLDAARYADTIGIHTDAGRQIWPYRDWILRAIRDDMPFDQFVTEQLAGDLLDNPTTDQKVATGFNRCHVMTDEGGAIAEEYLAEYAAERATTTSSVFLGLTVGCARCHDHKFDPISIDDFYSLTSFFNSVEEPGLYSQLPDSNRAFEPFLTVPDERQQQVIDALTGKIDVAKKELESGQPGDEERIAAFLESAVVKSGVSWMRPQVISAASPGGAQTTVAENGIVTFSGKNPDKDDAQVVLRTTATGLRLLLVEILPDPATKRPGRAYNGNAVITGISLRVTGAGPDAAPAKEVPLTWAWADQSQMNGDYDITNVLDPDDKRGWALAGHFATGGRLALLLTSEPFGEPGGSQLTVTLHQRSIYAQHNIAAVRVRVGTILPEGAAMLPIVGSRWQLAGPFAIASGEEGYTKRFGPEEGRTLDFKRNFGEGNQYWRFAPDMNDAAVGRLAGGTNVSYVGKSIFSPTARELTASLGSDDGFMFFIAGTQASERRVDRAVAADQDSAAGPLAAGENAVVLKVINTGGDGGAFFRARNAAELEGDLVAALLPPDVRSPELNRRADRAWRTEHSPRVKELEELVASLDKQKREAEASIPRTMVMKELAKPRETFVLTRGVYDQPDKTRPVGRRVPTALGSLAEDAPRDRRGLAAWLVSPENPLAARVAANRLWERFFGIGIVKTSEDFGFQGEWPSHPELLDWLAVEFRERGWRVSHLIRLIVTSSTYRQSSNYRPELAERDSEDRLLARFPRRRLTAEQLRDQALYVSGLMVETMGGPSVKPYQPDGLWQEVSMPASNTRLYAQGEGDDLYRRSLYTYWKRAVPPPSMAAMDAPTRESCVVRRTTTNTPLQSLVLWNDEQFVEASRALAQRVLLENPVPDGAAGTQASDEARLTDLFRRVTARRPDPSELASLAAALRDLRAGFAISPEDAARLTAVGDSKPADTLDRAELAAWTMIANAVLNLHESIMQR